ncbi:MAG: indole-3-glycerol phosphate synthase TrpC [Bacteroidota bacterium]
MNILDKIVARKKVEVQAAREKCSLSDLEQSTHFQRDTYSLKARLANKEDLGIIAEFKRHSPSQGDINIDAQVATVTQGYAEYGAVALSVLTDTDFFKGQIEDVRIARAHNQIPVLRKEFIVDEYQIFEAKSIGADVILLIAECLTAAEIAAFSKRAQSLGLEVLLEVHSGDQLQKLTPDITVVGVNNRNLKTFKVDTQTSIELYHQIPDDFLCISESGINDPNTIYDLRRQGFDGFLIGEYFMRAEQPHLRFEEFVQRVRYIEDLLNNAIA